MFRPRVILGPPGTGKSESILRLLAEELARGVSPLRIAVVTFTRAARDVVFERMARQFGLAREHFPWIRTIHSAAFRVLGLEPGRILDDERWNEFASRFGYDFSPIGDGAWDLDGDPTAPPERTEDDRVRYAYDWGRNCLLTPEQTLARIRLRGINVPYFQEFVARLERFKREHGLLDFCDLLMRVVESGARPPVDVAFIDEAQDLSPLQIKVCERWFSPCQRSYVAGDEDQTIYGFQGADPAWLLELARRREPEILRQSHRVPEIPHRLALSVIRQNRQRVEKAYEPAPRPGVVLHTDRDQAVDLIDPSVPTLALARNRMFLAPVAHRLMQRSVPYIVEGPGAPSPLSNHGLLRAIETARRISSPESAPIPAQELKNLVDHVSVAWVSREARTRLQEDLVKGARFTRSALETELGLAQVLRAIASAGPVSVMRVSVLTRRYLEEVLRAYGEFPVPKVALTTIHRAKGRQAESVVVLPSLTRATHEEYLRGGQSGFEAENRVLYVAVTRTQEKLILVQPRGRRHYDIPSVGSHGSEWRDAEVAP